ncbi:hypothetical protein, partial [Pseudomonas syringae group genomosp. 7]|uniref:hypothetical protein n=1 Tax=Pseudomonas syringae group genomosp. 7 TaxID=251699 RepID=UPI00377067DA
LGLGGWFGCVWVGCCGLWCGVSGCWFCWWCCCGLLVCWGLWLFLWVGLWGWGGLWVGVWWCGGGGGFGLSFGLAGVFCACLFGVVLGWLVVVVGALLEGGAFLVYILSRFSGRLVLV